MTSLQAGAFLDWGATPPIIPAGMQYIHVLRVGNPYYQTTLNLITPPNPTLKSIIKTYPGGFWIIGNEPDTFYGNPPQDALTADVYASRYFTIASRIRALDPTAKIGFGTIVQPTHIRLRYLDLAWAKLKALAGSDLAASSLIDIWTSHGFILNEVPGQWGTGSPPGFENDHADAVVINPPYSDTYSISIFSKRIKDFRQWLQKKGEQNKALWITEYGSLFPPITLSNVVTVPDALTLRFMVSSFDFMMNAADPSTGMPLDNNHLVQSWFWYSLNDYRYIFGGSLFDIGTEKHPLPPTLTSVGKAFMNYAPKDNIYSEFLFNQAPSLRIDPVTPSHLNFSFRVANTGTSSRQSARVWVYRDEPNGTPLAVIDTLPFQGCGDSMLYSGAIDYPASAQGFSKLYFRLDTNGDGAPHGDDEIVVLDAPPAVSGLTAVARSRSRIRLDWTGSPNADGYRIERSANGGTTWNNPTSVGKDTTTFMSTGLTCNIPYQYRVRAYNSQGNWGSTVASARTDGCATPTISLQVMSQKRINLSWLGSLTLTTASGFKVMRSFNGSSSGWTEIGTAPGEAIGYSDIPLACGTPYYYQIQPFNNNDGITDNWGLSNIAHTSTNPCGPPPKPIGLAANPHTSHSNVLTWTQLDDADTYQLERSLNGSTGWISMGSPLSQNTTRFLDNQAEPGITYYYHLRASNIAYGDSVFSAAASVQTYLYDFFTPFVLLLR